MKKLLSLAFVFLALGACHQKTTDSFVDKEYVLQDAENGAVITIGFDGKDHRFFGKSAVNRYFGTYTLEGDKLTFSPAGSTMMMGPQELMQAESNYLQNLGKIVSYQLDGKTLTLKTSDGKDLVFSQMSRAQKGEPVNNRYTKKALENKAAAEE